MAVKAERVRLTDGFAREAVPDAGKAQRGVDTIYWDEAVRGLGLKVTPVGTGSWVFQYWVTQDGKKQDRRITLGRAKIMAASAARAAAKKYETAWRNGGDPQRDKMQDRAASSVEDHAREWLQLQASRVARGELSKLTYAEYESKMM
jgi:hypothetical protein